MKVAVSIILLLAVMTGCHAPVYETMGNVVHVGQQQVHIREVLLDFPEDASVLASAGTDTLYICDGYTMSLQNFQSGDLAATIRSLCGYDKEKLTVMESKCGDHKRYDWVWVAAGEEGDVLCRGAILDDGFCHYSLCVSADAKLTGDLSQTWNELFESFCLASQEEV